MKIINVESVNKMNLQTMCQSIADWLEYQLRWTFCTKKKTNQAAIIKIVQCSLADYERM